MVYEWVLEALQYIGCKLLELVHRQVEGLHQLIKLYLVDVLAQYWVLASIAHDVDAAQVCYRAQYSVRAIQQSNLALVVWLLIVGDEHVEASLMSREFLLHLLYGHVLSLLDYPEVEALSLDYEIVLVANLLLDFLDGIAWEAWYDAVYEGSAYIAVIGKPLLEALIVGAHVFLPKLDILVDALLQVMAIEEDELARHQDHTLGRVALEVFVAVEEELYQLARVRGSWSICKLARVIECDTCLSGVRDDETHLWLLCQCHKSLVLRIWIQATADDVDALQCIDSLAVLLTLEIDVIKTVLTIEPVYHTLSQWLHYDNRTVEVGLLIHVPYNPIYECTEKVTFTKLDDFLRRYALRRCTLVQSF